MTYAAAYDTGKGFGSVGLVTEVDGYTVFLRDPVLGDTKKHIDDCYHLLWTESAVVLPFVDIVKTTSITSPWLEGAYEDTSQRMAANRLALVEDDPAEEFKEDDEGDTGFNFGAEEEAPEEFLSGYPKAWERVRVWREEIAPDWRTAALVMTFAACTIQTLIEKVEESYLLFGPLLKSAMENNEPVDVEGVHELPSFRQLNYHKAKAETVVSVIEYAPWLAERLLHSKDYSRKFRNSVAVENVARGLGMVKWSFSSALLGRDAACLDSRMMDEIFSKDKAKQEQVEKAWNRRSTGKDRHGFTRNSVDVYANIEDRVRNSEYFDPSWPMPFARAQWMMWEHLGTRGGGPTDHAALWDVLGI
jgi:hypothetical protein